MVYSGREVALGPLLPENASMSEPSRAFTLRRVTALVGPFGAGKSELAIGLAQWAARQAVPAGAAPRRVALADLDVIKPYFRSREVVTSLRAQGIGLIAPAGALAQADLPILTPELRGTVSRGDTQLILDVGGDPVGARALGSISDVVGATDYDLLLVLNRNRPFMDRLDSVIAHVRGIAEAAHLSFTGVIANTHMMDETTLEDIEGGLVLARAVAAALAVPVRLLGVPQALAGALAGRTDLPPIVAIRRHMLPEFLGGLVLAPASLSPQPAGGIRS